MNQCANPLQKIDQTVNYTYKAKIQTSKQINQHTITQYGCAHTIQSAEMTLTQAKKL